MRLLALVLAVTFTLVAPAADAQQGKVCRVGLLSQASPPPPGTPGLFGPALRPLGYVDGQNVVMQHRWAGGQNERFPALAGELVALKVDVIVSDPVGSGLVDSRAHPGRNVTGSTDFGIELAAKLVDLLHAAVPRATRFAVLMSDNPVHPSQLKEIQAAAKSLGLTVLPTMAKSADDFEAAFASMAEKKAAAFILLGGAPFSTEEQITRGVARG